MREGRRAQAYRSETTVTSPCKKGACLDQFPLFMERMRLCAQQVCIIYGQLMFTNRLIDIESMQLADLLGFLCFYEVVAV